jgi:hypothetical protein
MDVSSVACSVYAQQMKQFDVQGLNTEPLPEIDALRFYQLNHALALIQQKFHPLEPLPKEYQDLVTEFFEQTSIAVRRAIFYLIIICTRETRHLHAKSAWTPKLSKKYGAKVAEYVCSLPDDPKTAMGMFKKNPPDAAIGPYVEAIYEVFNSGSWSTNYGGKKWAAVTDCLRSFVTGNYSMVMLLDTMWTLSHNTGPIFNKGDLYSHHLGGNYLVKILDVQRAGMIPTFIADKGEDHTLNTLLAKTPDLLDTNKRIHELFDLPRIMDWAKVNELGSVQQYDAEGYANGHKPYKPIPPKPKVPMFTVYNGFDLPYAKLQRAA